MIDVRCWECKTCGFEVWARQSDELPQLCEGCKRKDRTWIGHRTGMRSALAPALLAFLLAGCGGVTTEQLGPEGGAAGEQGARRGDADTVAEAAADHGLSSVQDAGPDAPPSGPSCDQAAACAACGAYPCAAVIACARSGDAGMYPWQSCHNVEAAGFPLEGQLCAMHAACP